MLLWDNADQKPVGEMAVSVAQSDDGDSLSLMPIVATRCARTQRYLEENRKKYFLNATFSYDKARREYSGKERFHIVSVYAP